MHNYKRRFELEVDSLPRKGLFFSCVRLYVCVFHQSSQTLCLFCNSQQQQQQLQQAHMTEGEQSDWRSEHSKYGIIAPLSNGHIIL